MTKEGNLGVRNDGCRVAFPPLPPPASGGRGGRAKGGEGGLAPSKSKLLTSTNLFSVYNSTSFPKHCKGDKDRDNMKKFTDLSISAATLSSPQRLGLPRPQLAHPEQAGQDVDQDQEDWSAHHTNFQQCLITL